MLELRHLRYFVVTAEELHFTRAARRLGMTQPALSQQIKQLEALIGFPLLSRTKRRVTLTEAGQQFLQEARKTLAQAEQTVYKAASVHEGKQGRLNVGFLASFTCYLPEIVARYKQLCPHVTLNLRELTSAQQDAALQKGSIDIGFARDVDSDALHIQTLHSEALRLAVPEQHPLGLEESVPVASLEGETFVLFPKHLGPSFHGQIIGICEQAGFTPNIVQEATQLQTVISLVAGGLGVAFAPLSSCRRRVGVKYLRLEPEPFTNLNLIQRRERRSAAQETFARVAQRIPYGEIEGLL